MKKDADEEKKSAGKKNKRSNKAQPMSLEQFNNLHSEVTGESGISESVVNSKVNEHDEEFFERIDNDTRKALDREQILGLRKAREVGWILFHNKKFLLCYICAWCDLHHHRKLQNVFVMLGSAVSLCL